MRKRTVIPFFVSVLMAFPIQAQDKTTIAILDLEGKGVSQTDANSITDRIRHELFQTGEFRVLEREVMEDILSEQGFQLAGCTSSECAVEAGRILGVEKMVAGSVNLVGNLYSIYLRMIAVETGEMVATASADCECPIEQVVVKSTKDVVGKLLDWQPASSEPIVLRRSTPDKRDGGIKSTYLPDRAMTLEKKKFFIQQDAASDKETKIVGGYTKKIRLNLLYGLTNRIELFLQLPEYRHNRNFRDLGMNDNGMGDGVLGVRYAIVPWSIETNGVVLKSGIRIHSTDIYTLSAGNWNGYYFPETTQVPGIGDEGNTDIFLGGGFSSKWINNFRFSAGVTYSINGTTESNINKGDSIELDMVMDYRLSERIMLITKMYRYGKDNDRKDGNVINYSDYTIRYIGYEVLVKLHRRLFFRTGLSYVSDDFWPSSWYQANSVYANLALLI